MPLAKRVVPCLDVDHGKVVKGINFLQLKHAGDPVEMAKRYSDEGADELVFLDITASSENRDILRGVVEGVAKAISIPFTVGGGIRNVADARLVLCSGADKVAVNTAAVEHPKVITELADVFGRQCVVNAIDAKRNRKPSDGKIMVETGEGKVWFEVNTYGGRKPTGRTRQRARHRKRRRRNPKAPPRRLHRRQSGRGAGSFNFPLQQVSRSSCEGLLA